MDSKLMQDFISDDVPRDNWVCASATRGRVTLRLVQVESEFDVHNYNYNINVKLVLSFERSFSS